MLDLSRLEVAPAGFGECQECAYRDGGSAAICYACAAQTIEPVAENHCEICDQKLGEGGKCVNHWCRVSVDERGFRWVYAIAMRTGQLERAIDRYKFSDRRGWAAIFGRVVVGYLDEGEYDFSYYDLIGAVPSFTGPGARRSWDPVFEILEAARVESAEWPFDDGVPRVIVKTAESSQMSRLALYERHAIGESELRPALMVPDPARVAGKDVLMLDDVFTDGTTLREVALKLRAAGARSVDGLVLARQPWRY